MTGAYFLCGCPTDKVASEDIVWHNIYNGYIWPGRANIDGELETITELFLFLFGHPAFISVFWSRIRDDYTHMPCEICNHPTQSVGEISSKGLVGFSNDAVVKSGDQSQLLITMSRQDLESLAWEGQHTTIDARRSVKVALSGLSHKPGRCY